MNRIFKNIAMLFIIVAQHNTNNLQAAAADYNQSAAAAYHNPAYSSAATAGNDRRFNAAAAAGAQDATIDGTDEQNSNPSLLLWNWQNISKYLPKTTQRGGQTVPFATRTALLAVSPKVAGFSHEDKITIDPESGANIFNFQNTRDLNAIRPYLATWTNYMAPSEAHEAHLLFNNSTFDEETLEDILFYPADPTEKPKYKKILKNVTHLDLSDCENITDNVIELFAQACPNLKSLNLSSCQQITNAGLQALAQNCQHLESLDLAFCDRITSKALKYFIACLNLRSLNLLDCRINDKDISEFREARPDVEIIE